MKSSRSRIVIVSAVIFVCLCLACIGIGGFISFRNRPPSSVTSPPGYYVRGSRVYYLGGFPSTALEISANPSSFKIIDSSYALDDTHVFFGGNSIADADPATFELLVPPFSRDVRHVYASGTIFSDDPAHFEILAENLTRDSQHAYWSDRIISDHPADIVLLDSQNYYTYVHDLSTVFVNGNSIPGADPASFAVISDAYSLDADHIYYFDEIIAQADPATFEVLEIPYAKDANSIFWMENLISKADPSTFRVLNANFECAADAGSVYYQDQVIPNFEPGSIPANAQVTNCDMNGIYFSP